MPSTPSGKTLAAELRKTARALERARLRRRRLQRQLIDQDAMIRELAQRLRLLTEAAVASEPHGGGELLASYFCGQCGDLHGPGGPVFEEHQVYATADHLPVPRAMGRTEGAAQGNTWKG